MRREWGARIACAAPSNVCGSSLAPATASGGREDERSAFRCSESLSGAPLLRPCDLAATPGAGGASTPLAASEVERAAPGCAVSLNDAVTAARAVHGPVNRGAGRRKLSAACGGAQGGTPAGGGAAKPTLASCGCAGCLVVCCWPLGAVCGTVCESGLSMRVGRLAQGGSGGGGSACTACCAALPAGAGNSGDAKVLCRVRIADVCRQERVLPPALARSASWHSQISHVSPTAKSSCEGLARHLSYTGSTLRKSQRLLKFKSRATSQHPQGAVGSGLPRISVHTKTHPLAMRC